MLFLIIAIASRVAAVGMSSLRFGSRYHKHFAGKFKCRIVHGTQAVAKLAHDIRGLGVPPEPAPQISGARATRLRGGGFEVIRFKIFE